MQTKGVVLGLPSFTAKEIASICEACQFGKQRRPPFPKEWHMSKGILDVIHSDVWRQKSEVFGHFQQFKAKAGKTTGRHVRCLRSDGGKKYFSDAFTTYLRKEGIQREFSYRHTPQQNSVAERKNRHIVEVARAMMNEKNLPKWYWQKQRTRQYTS